LRWFSLAHGVDGENVEMPVENVSLAPGGPMKILLCVLVPMIVYAVAGVTPAFDLGKRRQRKKVGAKGLLRVDADHDRESPNENPRTRLSRVGKFQRRS
jgi:hypothetical protein